jgi:hypothetical protein
LTALATDSGEALAEGTNESAMAATAKAKWILMKFPGEVGA